MDGPSRSLESDVRGSHSSTFEMMDSMERLYLPNEAEQSCPRVETSNCATARDSSRISSPASEILSIFHNARPDERLSPITYSILPTTPARSVSILEALFLR
jgi:hypothetical protein